jgi:hypothetical protein
VVSSIVSDTAPSAGHHVFHEAEADDVAAQVGVYDHAQAFRMAVAVGGLGHSIDSTSALGLGP